MKKLLILLGFIGVFFSSAIFAFAQTSNSALIVIPRNATVTQDFLKTGERIQILGTLKRDAYLAGETVTIDGTVEGDVLVAGGTVIITGDLKQDLRVIGGDIKINGGQIDGNVTIAGGTVAIDKTSTISGSIVGFAGSLDSQGSIGRGITAFGGEVTIGGNVKENLSISAGELSILSNASIAGELQYWSEVQADISNEASISGNISKFSFQGQDTEEISRQFDEAIGAFFLILKFVDLVMLLLVGILIMLSLPNYAQRLTQYIDKNFMKSFIVGILFSILTPIVSLLLIISVLGLPLGVVLMFGFVLILWVGKIFGLAYLGRIITNRSKKKTPLVKSYTIGLIFFMILSLIPVVDFMVAIIVTSIGVGTLLVSKKQYYQELRSKEII